MLRSSSSKRTLQFKPHFSEYTNLELSKEAMSMNTRMKSHCSATGDMALGTPHWQILKQIHIAMSWTELGQEV